MSNFTANLNVVTGLSVATQDLLATLIPTTVTRTLQGLTTQVQQASYAGSFIVPGVLSGNLLQFFLNLLGGGIPCILFIRNIGPSGQFNMGLTFAESSPAAVTTLLSPGAFFFYQTPSPATSSTGITSLTVQATNSSNPIAEIFCAV